MHEYHAVESVVDEIVKKARDRGAATVQSVTLVVGELLGFSEDSIRLYFETFSGDELFKKTQLIIEHGEGREFYIDNIVVGTNPPATQVSSS